MSDLDALGYYGVRCNGCSAEHRGPIRLEGVGNPYTAEAIAAGWTAWASRGRRHYCPSCAPKPGHKMSEITRYYAPVGETGSGS